MDSAADPVSLSAAKGPRLLPISPPGSLLIRAPLTSEENDSPLASDTSEEEQEGFETASDPEEESINSALATAALVTPKGDGLSRSTSMPIKARVTRDDDPDVLVFVEELEDDDDEDDFYGIAKVAVSGQVPTLVDRGEGLKGEQRDGTSSETHVSRTTEGDFLPDSLKIVSDENPKMEDSSKNGNLEAEEQKTVENPIPQSTKEKPIEDEDAVDGTLDKYGEHTVSDPQEEKDGNLVEELGETASPDIGAIAELKRVDDESEAADVEEEGETNKSSTKEGGLNVEEAKSDTADEFEMGMDGSGDSTHNINQASVPDAHTPEEKSAGSYPAEDIQMAEGSWEKLDQLNDNIGHAKSWVSLTRGSEEVDDKAAEDSADGVDSANVNVILSHLHELGDETPNVEPNQSANDSEVNKNEPLPELLSDGDNSISVQDKQFPFIIEEKSKGNEGDTFETSGVTEANNDQLLNSVSEPELTEGSDFAGHEKTLDQEKAKEDEENLGSDEPSRVATVASLEGAKEMIKELDEESSTTGLHSVSDSSMDVDDQIILDSDEEVATYKDDEGNEMIDSDALVALLKAASSSTADGGPKVTSQDANRIFSVVRPAGLGSSIPSLKPAPPRHTQPNILSPSELTVAAELDDQMTEEQKKLHEKVELIKVKFLRLVYRLGHSPEDTVAAQVLYRLSLAEGIRSRQQISRAFSLESAKKKALQLERDGTEGLDFCCNILVLGKSGVGKSATINSIFGEEMSQTNAFKPATSSVKEIIGTVDGVKIRVVDTPGLRASGMDQASSRRILTSIKKYTKRCPPDIVLYVDRMDTLTRDQNDLPLLRTITSTLGSSIWFNVIVALTHAASAPPDGPSGSPLSYEVFVAQRSHAVQQSIRLAAGDMRLMNPVALVENHPTCRKNREGQKVLPNGQSWRPQMLLLCCSSKILSEANSLLKLQDASPGKLFGGFRLRAPPLPFLLSSLMQSRPHPKLPAHQGGENEDSDMDLDDLSDAEQGEEEDEYDQLPPFKPLKKSQIAKLTKEQRRAYFDEYDYRVKLLQKKQWKEELRRLRQMKNQQKVSQDDFGHADTVEDFDQDNAPATVPVPLPDMVLPPSFDCDAPTYRYRFLEPTSQFLARPVLDTHGWDHDCGFDGVSLEEGLAVAGRFPAVLSAQVTKDKKEFSIHLDSSISAKHGENGSTLSGFDIQAVGKQLAYTLRGETKFKTSKKNRSTGGISIIFLGETVATGLKFEDQLSIGKQVNLLVSTGAVRAQGDTAYGANLEVRLRDKDYPISQTLSTLGLSLIRAHRNLAVGANLQSQFAIGRSSKMSVRVGLNNKQTGQITVRTSSTEQLQFALVGIIPIAISIFRSMRSGESSTY
ncbi:hypothetical protein GW17_00000014 [Ensete ventricosum]|nr:hypothetical protein GW17_00000014 [Ensete ventricosum]